MDAERIIFESNEFELKRRSEFDSDIAIPLGILTVMCGFWYSLAGSLTRPLGVAEWLSLILLIFCALFISAGAIFLWIAHVGVTYKTLATAGDLEKYRVELKRWGELEARSNEEVENAFLQHVRSTLIESAQFNAEVNSKRSTLIVRQKQMLGIGLVILAAAGLVQLVSNFYFPTDTEFMTSRFGIEIISHGSQQR